MPKIELGQFGKHPRVDCLKGFEVITPTTMKYIEVDGSDVRVHRVRVYNPKGILEHTYLRDTMGAPFKDMSHIEDDLDYLESLKS